MAKPGKYAAIVKKLPREWGTEPDFQQKIEAVKAAIINPPEADATDPITDDVLEDMLMNVEAFLKVVNDGMIASLHGNMMSSKVAAAYRRVRLIKDTMEKQEKVTNVLLEAYKQLLTEQYEQEDIRSFSFMDGGSVSVQEEPHAKVVDREKFRKWIDENDLSNSLTLPWQTTNAIAKDLLLKGEELPPGLEATSRPKVVVRS